MTATRSSARRGSGALLASALLLAIAPAHALEEESAVVAEIEELDQETLDRAEALFFQALAHYRQGRYEAAAVDFQQAYVLTAHRDLLFNIARSRERVGDLDGAVEWYRAYLATQPADETAIVHRIRQLGADPSPDPRTRPRAPTTPDPAEPGPAAASSSPWPYVALGAGVVAAGAGVYFGLDALDLASQARAAETASTAQPLADDAEQSALIAHVTFGVAAAAVGTAVVLWWLEDDAAHAAGRVDVGLVPGGGGYVGYGGRF